MLKILSNVASQAGLNVPLSSNYRCLNSRWPCLKDNLLITLASERMGSNLIVANDAQKSVGGAFIETISQKCFDDYFLSKFCI